MNSIHTVKFGLLAATALGVGMATPAFAAAEDGAASGSDIIVTARRVEERLQDVPISITVLSGETISENNIVSASDIATFTPNLSVNRRFGDEGSTFTIRGFNQENGTAATVGVYFADVVMLRGGGESANGGDGAGPGSLYDLENIQVLKGPQGTLQGRNSTGGAVLLVPTKPKSDFGGYVEGSLGDYDLRRVQAAVNVPVGDTFRFRLAGDRMKRKGYLKNLGFPGANGPRDFADTNYTSLRFSAVADLSPDVENYTIVAYTESDNNGVIPSTKQCVPGVAVAGIPLGNMACAQIAREAPSGFWTVSNGNFEAESYVRTWQVINTTTVQLSDAVEFKNIFSYGELKARSQLDFFGNFFPLVPADQVTGPSQIITFVPNAAAQPYNRTISQSTMVEEMRLSGSALDGKLDWQGGLYWELSTPLGYAGQQYGQLTPCADTPTLNCTPRGGTNVSAGSINYNIFKSRFEGKAIYGQATYSFSDQLSVTGGFRYTWDEVTKKFSRNPRTATGAPALEAILPTLAFTTEAAKFDAPTWLIGVDFKPVDDVLVYAKYSRGYRQGNINASSGPGLRKYKPETVDTFEGGVKAEWRGALPGRFNASLFYNTFKDQQLQVRLSCSTNANCPVATATVNAGKSRMYGLEADFMIKPFDLLELSASYGYLNTKVQAVQALNLGVGQYDIASGIPIGASLPYAPKHNLTLNGKFTLPLPESVGEVSIGGTLIYSARYTTGYEGLTVAGAPTRPVDAVVTGFRDYNLVPAYTYGNVNLNWDGIGGLPVDATLFVTNVTNKKMVVAPNEQYVRGFISYYLAPPRMWGLRLKYRFGALAD